MRPGSPIVRWIALVCAVLIVASNVHAPHAIAETYLHAHAVPHPASTLAGVVHDHDARETSDHRGDHQGAIGHHHHADHNVDAADIAAHSTVSVNQPFELIGVRLVAADSSVLPNGLDRPPRA